MNRDKLRENEATKKPAIEVLKELGYQYIHPDAIPVAKRGELL